MGPTLRALAVITAVLTLSVEREWIFFALVACAVAFVLLGAVVDNAQERQDA